MNPFEFLWNTHLRVEIYKIWGERKGEGIVQYAEISVLPIGPIKKIAIGFSYSHLIKFTKNYFILNYGASGRLK